MFVAIIAATFCCFLVNQGTNAGSTVYLNQIGESATLAGIGATVFSVAAAIVRIVCGPIIDNKGRLIVITVGSLVSFISVLGPAVYTNIDFFLFWRFLQGVGFAAMTTAAATAAADVLPVERLGEGIGYAGLGQALAMAIGPAIAITLASSNPPENLYRGLAVIAVCAIVMGQLCRYEKHPERLPESSTYRRIIVQRAEHRAGRSQKENLLSQLIEKGALAGGIPIMVLSPVLGFAIFFCGLLGTEMGIGNAGFFYTTTAISMIGVRLASKSFMDRIPAIKIHTVGVIGAVIAFSLLIFAVSADLEPAVRAGLYYFAGLPYGLCPGLGISINQAMAVKNSPAERWGAANGLYQLLLDVGIGIAATIWGITNDNFGFAFTMACVIVLAIASIFAARFSYPESDRHWRKR